MGLTIASTSKKSSIVGRSTRRHAVNAHKTGSHILLKLRGRKTPDFFIAFADTTEAVVLLKT